MPYRCNTKLSMDLFTAYVVMPLRLFNGDKRISPKDINQDTEFDIAKNAKELDGYGVVELYKEVGPILVAVCENFEAASTNMNRRYNLLKKLRE